MMELDLADLLSVSYFAKRVQHLLGGKQLQLLVLYSLHCLTVALQLCLYKLWCMPLSENSKLECESVQVLNAGISGGDHALSKQGHELQFATNHLGHFHLTQLLLPDVLSPGTPPRRYHTSIPSHRGYWL